jgi:hypothetical protein
LLHRFIMNVPNAEQAVVPQNKVENYLLDLGHPIGGDKARFFLHFGFRRKNGLPWPTRCACMSAVTPSRGPSRTWMA